MGKPLIVANWKMNPETHSQALRLFKGIAQKIRKIKNVEVVICAPFPYLYLFQSENSNANIRIGAQNCFWQERGPFTGEVSPTMLKDLGCEYVILGHSEREIYLKETLQMVNKKVSAALKAKLRPILCIGEKEKKKRERWNFLEERLKAVLQGIPENQIRRIIFVYEPVWAISSFSGRAASPKDMVQAALLIKKVVRMQVPILYGGSVDSKNIKSFLGKDKAQGVLVGGASLKEEEFTALVKNATMS